MDMSIQNEAQERRSPSSARHRMDAPPPKLSVVMPVYNERATIEQILARVQAVEIEKEIVIVDDGSTDGTREFLCKLDKQGRRRGGIILPMTGDWLRADNVRVFFQPKNRGKGAAVRRGFSEARGQFILVQDADLELDPQDYFKLLEPIEQGRADVVYGSRFLSGRPPGEPLRHYLGNRLLTLLSNLLTGLRLSDVWTCYKALRRDALQSLELNEDRFSFEPELTARIAQRGFRICEVPVSYFPRTHAEGKKIRLWDGIKGVWATIRYNFFAPALISPRPGVTTEGLNQQSAGSSARSGGRSSDICSRPARTEAVDWAKRRPDSARPSVSTSATNWPVRRALPSCDP
ncbi:MAG: glycosyltransferase family 2 protein [Blastocatellia bacterium]